MKKQKLILETSPFKTDKFKVVKVINTLEYRPGDWLEMNNVRDAMCDLNIEVEIRDGSPK